jgi:hypothetical protein
VQGDGFLFGTSVLPSGAYVITGGAELGLRF